MIPFAKLRLVALGLTGGFATTIHAAFAPMPFTPGSFNEDMVVEASASGPVIAGAYTTASMDNGTGNTGTSWYEEGYNTAAPTTGLPHPGTTFTSQSSSSHTYAMAPSYAANNAMMLDAVLTSGTFTLATPAAYAGLSFLESGGNNGVTFGYAVHHQDGTTETGSASIPDWFNGSNPAWDANGRVDVDAFTFQAVNASNPRLYSLDITLANTASPVTSISFTYISGGGHGAIMAVSGGNGTTFSPITVTGYNEDIVVEAAAAKPGALTGATTATMDAGTNNTGSTFYEMGYEPQAPATGLPHANTVLTNVSAADHLYLMPPDYTAKNTVLVTAGQSTAMITITSPVAASALSFLAAAGHGPVTVGCSVYHADGHVEQQSFTIQDWFTYAPVAWYANGRVYVNNSMVDSVNSGNPRLYAQDMALTDTTNPVTQIQLDFLSGATNATLAVFAVSGGVTTLPLAENDFNANLSAGTTAMQQWYTPGGLYFSCGWWNAANCIEAVVEDVSANSETQYLPVFTNTLYQNNSANFADGYYDDEGWWALSWIHAYDITGNTNFLGMAKTIFRDMTNGWDTTNTECPGGLWWNTSHSYKNAIPNELFLSAAIRLHQRTPGDSGTGSYFYWATNEWTWFKDSGLINSQNLINDGLNGCVNNGQTTWTYNQGVILSGLTDLYRVTRNLSYLTEAEAIANAAITFLTDSNGVLIESCEASESCGGDGPEFKGIFQRNLTYLYDTVRMPEYYDFLYTNAHAVWFNDRNTFNQLGLKWDGPYDTDDGARQSSALMAENALAEPVTAALPFAKGSGDPAFSHAIGGAAGTLGWSANAGNATRADFLQYGPYLCYLPAGPHAVHFHLSVNALGSANTNLAQLDVRENNGGTLLATANVSWSSFVATNAAQDFVLLFTNAVAADPLEFRVYWNDVADAPAFIINDVTVDGLQNWCATSLMHDFGQLDGLNGWYADLIHEDASGYLTRGLGVGGISPGDYTAWFELKVDNFNWDNSTVAQLLVVDTDDNITVASTNLTRGQFPNVLYQEFPLGFTAAAGKHYDFRTYWIYGSTAPRLTQRSVMLRPGPVSFFTGAQWDGGTGLTLNLIGVPGKTYTVQSTPSLTNPQWTSIGSVTVPAYLDNAQFKGQISGTNNFYRLSQP